MARVSPRSNSKRVIGLTSNERQLEFAEFVRIHHARLFGFVRTLVFDPNDAQDVFQETVLALWQAHESYDRQRDFGAWAIGVARNKVFDYYKSRQRERGRLGDEVLKQLAQRQEESAETTAYLEARRVALAACLDKLPQRQSELVRRCYDGSETVRDVAASLRRTTGSIYSSLNHIRKGLLECIRRRLSQEYGRA